MKIEKIKTYGTEEETIVETTKGIFLVQSPGMTVEYEELCEIPEGFEPVNWQCCLDLEIPEEIL